jgi:hypothetical protein
MSTAYSQQPTQAQIMRALKRVPALQRDEIIASTYLGRPVCWKTRFFDALDINQYDIKQFSFTQRNIRRPVNCAAGAGSIFMARLPR